MRVVAAALMASLAVDIVGQFLPAVRSRRAPGRYRRYFAYWALPYNAYRPARTCVQAVIPTAWKKQMKTLLATAAILAALIVPGYSASIAAEYEGELHIKISGEFKIGDDIKFKELIKWYKIDNMDVVLDSPGGAFIPALNIGEKIRDLHWHTKVEANVLCASSCAYIWLAGAVRKATASSMIGFHRIYITNLDRTMVQEDPIDNAYLGRYLGSLGFGYPFIKFVTSAGPSQMNYLTVENAKKYAVNFEGDLPASNQQQTIDPNLMMPRADSGRFHA
jgi:hypothetical protein